MKRAFFLSLLTFVFLAGGLVSLKAEESALSYEDLSFEQIENFRNERKYDEIIAALQPEDLTSKAGDLGKDADQLYALRGLAYHALKRGDEAEADYKRAIAESPEDARNTTYWYGLAENYRTNMNDPAAALSAYQKTVELCFQRQYKTGWLPIQATIYASDILCSESKFDEALIMLQPYNEVIDSIPPNWQIKLQRAFGAVYKGQGKEDEANARFQKAQDLEGKP